MDTTCPPKTQLRGADKRANTRRKKGGKNAVK